MYYAFIKNNKIDGCGECRCLSEHITNIVITEEVFNNIEQYMYEDGEIIINPDYAKEKAKTERIEEILARLKEIDNKSIRAIRANDTEYVEAYELEAESLREELRGLNNDK
jgi:hypothetical protein